MAGRLAQILDPSRILLDLRSTQRTAAINEVALRLEGHPDITHFKGFYDELLARERAESTYLGNELALPHSRTEHVRKIVLAVGRSTKGILFEHDNQTVRLIFVLGTPIDNPTDYLKIVSALCKVLKDPANRETLMAATTPDAFVAALIRAEEKLLIPAVK